MTSVDLAAQDVVFLLLHNAFPDSGIDAEEKTEALLLFPPMTGRRPNIVIDPLDGTFELCAGSTVVAGTRSMAERIVEAVP